MQTAQAIAIEMVKPVTRPQFVVVFEFNLPEPLSVGFVSDWRIDRFIILTLLEWVFPIQTHRLATEWPARFSRFAPSNRPHRSTQPRPWRRTCWTESEWVSQASSADSQAPLDTHCATAPVPNEPRPRKPPSPPTANWLQSSSRPLIAKHVRGRLAHSQISPTAQVE